MKRSGRWWVAGLLGLGAVAGLIAVTYWKHPGNSVRWSFTLIHSSLVRGKKENAARLLAPKVTWNGKTSTADEFLQAYVLPAQADRIEALPAPQAPGCWKIVMGDLSFGFLPDGNVWKLYWIGRGEPPPPEEGAR